MSTLHQHVSFSFIRYANCWEDADVLIHALALPPQQRILCIASAGDNALALLSTHPDSVQAIDLSPVQLYLAELKQMAFAVLSYDEMVQLLGVGSNDKMLRKKIYHHLKPHLSQGAQHYWNEHIRCVENGIVYGGKFEQYFKTFRTFFLPFVHSKKEVQKLLEPKQDAEQAQFYERIWNTRRWQLLMQLFFSKRVMGKYGRDPQFLKHVTLTVPQYIRQKSEAHLRSAQCTQNYFLHMIFTGTFGTALPFYLRKENFEIIRNNIHKLSLSQSSAEEAVKAKPYNAYCFSDIFEYMSVKTFEAMVNDWYESMPEGSKLAYWNLMADRSFSAVAPQKFKLIEPDKHLPDMDKGFFYSRFILEERS